LTDPYWDGGIYSNTPIETVFDDHPRRDSIVFTVQMWHAEGPEPESVWQVLNRQKDIQYASRADSHILLVSATCRRNGPASTSCSAFLGNNRMHPNRVSDGSSRRAGKRKSETNAPKPFLRNSIGFLQRPGALHATPPSACVAVPLPLLGRAKEVIE
jgi:predicted acylesterase/phospholipase RssA